MYDIIPTMVISDWTAISSIGIGKYEFIKAYQSLSKYEIDGVSNCGIIHSFNPEEVLGTKGIRGMDRLSKMCVVSVSEILGRHNELNKDRLGVVVCASTGGIKSEMDFIGSLRKENAPEMVDPIQFPKSVMNCAAGQVGIWHKITGLNATLAGGRHCAYAGVKYAASKILTGHIDSALVLCVEEFSEYSEWLWRPIVCRENSQSLRLGEGCAALLLERCKESGPGEIIDCRYRSDINTSNYQKQSEILFDTVVDMLKEHCITSADVECALMSVGGDKYAEMQRDVLEKTIGKDIRILRNIESITGTCFSVSAAFQIISVLCNQNALSDNSKPFSVILTVSEQGPVGTMILRNSRRTK